MCRISFRTYSFTLRTAKPIVWNVTLDLSFKELKEHMCNAPFLLLPNPSKPNNFIAMAPILMHPHLTKPYFVEINASNFALTYKLFKERTNNYTI